jgi:hypothetical protein
MEDNHVQPFDLRHQDHQPRRFVYRAAQPDADHSHPMRRSTDTPRAFQAIPGQLCPGPVLLKFRVYLKLN